MTRPRSVHSGCFVRGALAPAGRSPETASVCGGEGVPGQRVLRPLSPKAPVIFSTPRAGQLCLQGALAVPVVAGGAQGVWGAAPLVPPARPPRAGAEEQLKCWVSCRAAAVTPVRSAPAGAVAECSLLGKHGPQLSSPAHLVMGGPAGTCQGGWGQVLAVQDSTFSLSPSPALGQLFSMARRDPWCWEGQGRCQPASHGPERA